jgi:hypothetical protein
MGRITASRQTLARAAGLEFRLQFVGRAHLQIIVVYDETPARRERNRPIDCDQALSIERIISMRRIPSLPVEAVRDIELGPGITQCGIGASKRRTRFDKLVFTKEVESIVEGLLVDRIGAERS